MQTLTQNNRMLTVALGVSLGVHALALAVRFVDPELLRLRSTDPALEIILVNSRSQARPSQPEAYAQANLDGGGAHDAGRRSSPLPNLMQQRDGDIWLHKSCEPLESAVLTDQQDLFTKPCASGMCFT